MRTLRESTKAPDGQGRIRGFKGTLRLEDVARLVRAGAKGVGDLERGNAPNGRAPLHERVANLLGMDEAARSLFSYLAVGVPPPAPLRLSSQLTSDEIDVLRRAGRNPALIVDHAGNVLASNTALSAWFSASPCTGVVNRNVYLWLLSPEAAERISNINEIRSAAVELLSIACTRFPHDEELIRVVERIDWSEDDWPHTPSMPTGISQGFLNVYVQHPRRGEVRLIGKPQETAEGRQLLVLFIPDDPLDTPTSPAR